MYQVFIAEDEPTALQYLCTIIENKCPDFQVVGTAENGKSALEQMEYLHPDVLITDVKMPVMDGIFLVKKVKEKYPNILSVIVSGYQEFEYAQTALKYGVCDYILKPVRPATLQESMYALQKRLSEYHYAKRNQMIRQMYTGEKLDPALLKKFFSDEAYYIALLRKNNLPRRFTEFGSVEIFSIKEEQMMLYGRDEMEALYICPVRLLFHDSFYQLMMHVLEKEQETKNFHTLVLLSKPVDTDQLPEKIRQLYQILNNHLIVGKNQIIKADNLNEGNELFISDNSLKRLEYLAGEGSQQETAGEIMNCFTEWEKKNYSQLLTEELVREMFRIFRKAGLLEEAVSMCDFYIDEAFYYAENMQKLGENICQILCRNMADEARKSKIDTPEFFEKIEKYMNEHLAEALSHQYICGVFGISQAYLSRLFRKYSTESFNKRLTVLRVERAKEIMKQRPELFIKDVASMVGYEDQFYFSRIFRSMTGVSPTEYLEKIKSVQES